MCSPLTVRYRTESAKTTRAHLDTLPSFKVCKSRVPILTPSAPAPPYRPTTTSTLRLKYAAGSISLPARAIIHYVYPALYANSLSLKTERSFKSRTLAEVVGESNDCRLKVSVWRSGCCGVNAALLQRRPTAGNHFLSRQGLLSDHMTSLLLFLEVAACVSPRPR